MAEKARLRVQKTKKGGFAAQVEFASGKSMPLPPWYEVTPAHDDLECEVEREEGRITKVCVGGRELPRRGEGRTSTGPRGRESPPAARREEKPPRRAGVVLLVPSKVFLPRDTLGMLRGGSVDNLGLYLEKLAGYTEAGGAARFSFPLLNVKLEPPVIGTRDFFRLVDERRREALKASGLEFRRVVAALCGRLVVGLGAESVYEASLALHPLYGFPYVPASAVKGAVRSAAIWEEFGGREDRARENPFFCLVFGVEECRGAVCFFDAYPLEPPTVTTDIMNPHYAPYYRGEDSLPPGDYYNPVPVFFGVVEGAHLVFYVAWEKDVRESVGRDPLEKAVEWLKAALSAYGLGAKTSAGYGVMRVVEENGDP